MSTKDAMLPNLMIYTINRYVPLLTEPIELGTCGVPATSNNEIPRTESFGVAADHGSFL
jgi:hypothetical protein